MKLFNYLKEHPKKLKIGSIKTLIKYYEDDDIML